MAFANCISRGNEKQIYAERPTEVPETTELLSIAFRLESLRIDLDKLAKKTDDIAKYYESTGSEDKERFKRVSAMFGSAVKKVDEIKEKLKDKVDSITIDDMVEIKQDIKYIKNVMLKDILYLMLSKEAGDVKERSENDCGTDDSCFGNALRVCKPITFYPDGDDGPKIVLKGLEGDSCIMYAVMEKFPDGKGPPDFKLPVDMTCKIKNYALGIRSPEEDIFPFCEGTMIEMIKKYGTEDINNKSNEQGQASKQESKQDFTKETERSFERGNSEFDNQQQNNFIQQPASRPQQSACIGCFDNGVCDANECLECVDCSRPVAQPAAVVAEQTITRTTSTG